MSRLRNMRLALYHEYCQEQDDLRGEHVLRAIALAEVISAIYVLLIFVLSSAA